MRQFQHFKVFTLNVLEFENALLKHGSNREPSVFPRHTVEVETKNVNICCSI